VKRATIAIVLAALAAGSSARADAQTDTQKQAQRWFDAGLHAPNDEAALASFSAAYALVPSVDILWNVAMTERRLGRTLPALEHLRAYQLHPASRPERRATAERAIAELERDTARVASAVTFTVDGASHAAGSVDVMPGVHGVTVLCGDEVQSVAIDAVAGTRFDAVCKSHRDATPRDVTPPARAVHDAPPLEAASPPRDRVAPSLVMNDAPGRTRAVVALTAGAVVSVAGGVLFGSLANGARDDSNKLTAQIGANGFSCRRAGTVCSDRDAADSRGQIFGAASTGLFVTSGLLGGAAIMSFLLWPKREMRVAPSTTGMGASVMGTL
jgi:hypothetical protein